MATNGAPDPSQASDLAEFITALGELRHWAGGLSYRALAKRVGPRLRPPQHIAHTTVSSVFQPRRRRLDIDLVTTIVRALGVCEPEVALWRQACVRVHVAAKTGGPVGPLRQLPADLATLTGRDTELKQLLHLATPADDKATTVVVSAIDGMAGIGKTALAVHAAHLLAEEFPDGQLFVDLHAHTAGTGPRDPNDALGQMLQALGLDPQAIPAELEERAKTFRNRLAGSRTLILLDDAASEQQVRPLLPATSGCLVLVTSRNRLKALDDAHPLPLDVLAPADAIALLRGHAGPDRIAHDDPALARIAELCGYLPLALRITAANLAHRPTWTVDHLEARLRAGLTDLTAFTDGDRQVRAAFDLSYDNLTGDQQTMFRHLGLIPGPDTDGYAAAALLDRDQNEADALLQDLTDRSLLTETTPGRYRLHDLLREYAHALAVAHDPAEQRDTALDRLLNYYTYTVQTASTPIVRRPRLAPDSVAPAPAPDLTEPETALAWLRTERPNLDAACTHTYTHRLDHHTIALAFGMAEILVFDGPWSRAIQIHQAAAAAAIYLERPAAQATALTDLGRVRYLAGDFLGAADAMTRALEIFQRIGNGLGEADALTGLGRVRHVTGDVPGAADVLARALEIFQRIGNRLGEANALTVLGRVQHLAGDFAAAADAHARALQIFRQIGNRSGEATALNDLGWARHLAGDLPAAADIHAQAIEILRQIGNRGGEANALNSYAATIAALGDRPHALALNQQALAMNRELRKPDDEAISLEGIADHYLATGDRTQGTAYMNQALEIYRRLGMRPDIERVQTRLAESTLNA